MGLGQTTPRGTSGRRFPARLALLTVTLVILATVAGAPSFSGTVSLTWDPVDVSDLQGYRVYYGQTQGTYSYVLDSGMNTSATVSGLTDCSMWYMVVRAYDTENLEGSDSNVVKGWPRPVVASVSPSQISPGQTLEFVVEGINFDPGEPGNPLHPAALVALSHTGLIVRTVQVEACGRLRVTIQAPVGAQPGFSDLTVQNPDLSWGTPTAHPWVYGTLSGGIQVLPPDTTGPSILQTDPAAGAQDVPATAHAVVVFSETVNSATATKSTVRLLDDAGVPVAQAAGSPITEGARVTITPAEPLAAGKEYRIQVLGGSAGVQDTAGNPLAETYLQNPPFKVAGSTESPNKTATVTDSDPAPGELDVDLNQRQFNVVFDRDMSALWQILSVKDLQARFRIVTNGKTVKHASGSPALASDGRTVVITIATRLEAGGIYTTNVNLTGSKLKTALTKVDKLDLLMERTWSSSPQWSVETALDEVVYQESQDSTTMKAGTTAVPLENQGVPLSVKFRMTFNKPVASQSANNSIFKIVDKKKKAIRLASHPQLEDGGLSVVLEPAEPLDPGTTYTIQVRTGKSGLLLKVKDGYAIVRNPRLLTVTFTTEVSGEGQGDSLGVAE